MPRRLILAAVLLTFLMLGTAAVWTLSHRLDIRRPSDAALFEQWARGTDAAEVAGFRRFLAREGVADVVPLAELLRSDARWRRCNLAPFAVPPRGQWRNIAPTLRYVRDHVVPQVGRVRVVSAYRDPVANRCFGGASESRHLRFAALDLEPAASLDRPKLVVRLCQLHARTGRRYAVGLGVYKGLRFHIDTAGFRRWGHDFRAATSPCLNNS
jgi:Peptidase M15